MQLNAWCLFLAFCTVTAGAVVQNIPRIYLTRRAREINRNRFRVSILSEFGAVDAYPASPADAVETLFVVVALYGVRRPQCGIDH